MVHNSDLAVGLSVAVRRDDDSGGGDNQVTSVALRGEGDSVAWQPEAHELSRLWRVK